MVEEGGERWVVVVMMGVVVWRGGEGEEVRWWEEMVEEKWGEEGERKK